MRAAVGHLVDTLGSLSVAVANAGINGVWPIDDLKPDEWDESIAVNLRGTYLTLHLTVPHLKKAGGGSIVAGLLHQRHAHLHHAGRHRLFRYPAAAQVADGAAAARAGTRQGAGIRVNAVCPGAIETSIDENTEQRGVSETGIPVVWPQGDIPVSHGVLRHGRRGGRCDPFLASSEGAAHHRHPVVDRRRAGPAALNVPSGLRARRCDKVQICERGDPAWPTIFST